VFAIGDAAPPSDDALPVGPVPSDLPPVTGPQHFQMQFATGEEHVQLVERARALLARQRPSMTLGELHFEAMRLLVQALEKRKFAVTGRTNEQMAAVAKRAPEQLPSRDPKLGSAAPESPRQRGRYVTAAVRREVYQRDGARCTFVDTRGERCCETRYLELHHLQPFASGGPNGASNLTLRCAAHNALAAEQDFGAHFMAERRRSARHEILAGQPLERAPLFK
jgi:hypothetical protein